MIKYFLKLYRRKFYCPVMRHDWDIFGLVVDPRGRKKKADIAIICKDCELINTTTLSRIRDYNEYRNLFELGIFCYNNGYVVIELGMFDKQ